MCVRSLWPFLSFSVFLTIGASLILDRHSGPVRPVSWRLRGQLARVLPTAAPSARHGPRHNRAGPRHAAGADICPAQQPGLRSAPETGSAGRPPEQLLDTAALALGRTARAAVPGGHRDGFLAGRRGRAVVDIAPGGSGCAHTLGDDLLDDHDAFTSFAAQPHLVTGPYGMRGFDPYPVDPDVPGPAGNGRVRAGPGQPHRPDPAVYSPSPITCHPANCNAMRACRLRPA